MLIRLVLIITVSGVVTFSAVSAVDLLGAGTRKNSRVRRLRSFFSNLTRKELEITGQLSTEGAQPMPGVLVYADASRCSLALPLGATGGRKECNDKRVTDRTDERGYYRLPIHIGRRHKYLHVRFKIEQQGEQPTVIPLASVDQILGHMKAGSYYRLDREHQLRLVTKHRDLVYTSMVVPLDATRFGSHSIGDHHHIIKIMLHRTFRQILDQGEQNTAVGCGNKYNWRWDNISQDKQTTRFVDLRFIFPKTIPPIKFLARVPHFDCSLTTTSRSFVSFY